MHGIVLMESAARGLLLVNGQFCGPVDAQGQAFPAGKNAEIYIQLTPFEEAVRPLTAELILRDGRIARLESASRCFALHWPDGIIQLELRPDGAQGDEQAQAAAPSVLLRYLALRLSGDEEGASRLLMQAGLASQMPTLEAYQAVIPLRFAPQAAGGAFDERAGLVRRTAQNVAVVDAALAVTAPAGQGKRLIERIKIVQTA